MKAALKRRLHNFPLLKHSNSFKQIFTAFELH